MPTDRGLRKVETATVAVDGSASITMGPSSYGEEWTVTKVSCQVSEVVTNSDATVFQTYVNGSFAGGSYSGEMDTDSDYRETLSAQSNLTGRWTNAAPGATATMTITYDRMLP